MISRIWHGWTNPGNADVYELILKEEIFAGIQNRRIRGFKGIQLLRRDVNEEVEFVTIMSFDSLEPSVSLQERITNSRLSRRRPEPSSRILMGARSTTKSEPNEAVRTKKEPA
jgi:hypothetical protein